MPYSLPPIVLDGDTINGTWLTTYIRDNFYALWPYTTAGDLAAASGPTSLVRIPVTANNGDVLKVNLAKPGKMEFAPPASTLTLPQVYPVGCIYTSTVATNPATVFGFGTWVAFGAGRVLLGVGTSDATYAAGASGGESKHTLTTPEIPAHNHTQTAHSHSLVTWFVKLMNGADDIFGWIHLLASGGGSYNTNSVAPAIANAGGGLAHNNMPPYIVVYFWKRTA